MTILGRLLWTSLLFGVAFASIFELINFKTDDEEQTRFMFHPTAFYNLLGSEEDAAVCMNLTTSSSVMVALGSCAQSFPIGIFESGPVAFNRSEIDHAMDLARGDADLCKRRPIGIHLTQVDKPAKGTLQLFSCSRSHSWSRSPMKKFGLVETVKIEPMVSTWNDMGRDIPFNMAGEETWNVKVGLGRAIDAAIVDEYQTVCFSLHGAPFVKVTLSKCRNSKDFSILLPSDTVVGLSIDDKSLLRSMKQRKCIEKTRDDEWWIQLSHTDKNVTTGHLSVYSCKEQPVSDNEQVLYSDYQPNTEYMGYQKRIHFVQSPLTEGTFSADIRQILDVAVNDQTGLFKFAINLKTNSPVSIALSRCRNSTTSNRVILAQQQSSGMMIMKDLSEIINIMNLPKCQISDSDEALYLKIRSNTGAIGHVDFSLKHLLVVDPVNSIWLRTVTVFDVAEESSAVRKMDIGQILDSTLVNTMPLALEVNTTGNVTVSVSKCPGAQKHVLAMNVGSGIHPIRFSTVAAAINLLNSASCRVRPSDYKQMSVWFEAADHRATGTLRFVSLQVNGTRKSLQTYGHLDTQYKAYQQGQTITVSHGNVAQEVDIRLFVEIALADPNSALVVSADRPVTVVASRCTNSTKNGVTLNITKLGQVNLKELEDLRTIMKHPRCDNAEANGLFLHVQDPNYQGPINFFMNDVRKVLAYKSKFVAKVNDEHTVKVPFYHDDRALVFHIYNDEAERVQVAVSACGGRTGEKIVFMDKMTVGLFRFVPASIKIFREKSGCPESKVFYLTVRSRNATGTITMTKTAEIVKNSQSYTTFFKLEDDDIIPSW